MLLPYHYFWPWQIPKEHWTFSYKAATWIIFIIWVPFMPQFPNSYFNSLTLISNLIFFFFRVGLFFDFLRAILSACLLFSSYIKPFKLSLVLTFHIYVWMDMLSWLIRKVFVLIETKNQEDREPPCSIPFPPEMFWHIFTFLSLAKSKITWNEMTRLFFSSVSVCLTLAQTTCWFFCL